MRSNQIAAVVLSVALIGCFSIVALERSGPSVGAPADSAFDIGGVKGHAPPGSTVTLHRQSETHDRGGTENHEATASGVGAGLHAQGKDVDFKDFKSSPPGSLLPSGGGATGGSISFSAVIRGGSSTSWLMWAGILCVIGAVYLLYRGNISLSIHLGLIGAALMVASVIPPFAWMIMGLVAVGVAGVHIWMAHKHDSLQATVEQAKQNAAAREAKYKEPLRGVLAAVEDLPVSLRKIVKGRVMAHIENQTNDQQTIREVKREDGLPSERDEAQPAPAPIAAAVLAQ